ncbi:hypothetical protein M3Y98_00659500 [Aphelenchoides besseyi]|nr:hypothetical protein M3Y98_00659500 [Aphelenchoides besseyi]
MCSRLEFDIHNTIEQATLRVQKAKSTSVIYGNGYFATGTCKFIFTWSTFGKQTVMSVPIISLKELKFQVDMPNERFPIAIRANRSGVYISNAWAVNVADVYSMKCEPEINALDKGYKIHYLISVPNGTEVGFMAFDSTYIVPVARFVAVEKTNEIFLLDYVIWIFVCIVGLPLIFISFVGFSSCSAVCFYVFRRPRPKYQQETENSTNAMMRRRPGMSVGLLSQQRSDVHGSGLQATTINSGTTDQATEVQQTPTTPIQTKQHEDNLRTAREKPVKREDSSGRKRHGNRLFDFMGFNRSNDPRQQPVELSAEGISPYPKTSPFLRRRPTTDQAKTSGSKEPSVQAPNV